jgi:hypothetical protein
MRGMPAELWCECAADNGVKDNEHFAVELTLTGKRLKIYGRISDAQLRLSYKLAHCVG